ncbi:unnamed protein product [Cyprideis torosa]|uniref:Uncharacterized protein n=1 Tax=Cyprideis torosa TaxID=163714 RepID=A0A7R8W3I9_9CRUS|nr:unnamed protein product [Cyprideis torosa]CAG0880928.1 unnamed protein product [Cyprideis torosa]
MRGCNFPAEWQGEWYQHQVPQPFTIRGNSISGKGRCVESERDKFLVYNEEERCYQCLIITQKHVNVLQYKETFCSKEKSLSLRCAEITGDTLLFSLFRINAAPIKCPLEGSFNFSYHQGRGWCKSPVSTISQCTSPTQMRFLYHSCPDVRGTSFHIEDLTCIASWRAATNVFIIARVESSVIRKDTFRCIVYEKIFAVQREHPGIDYRMAQSLQGSCEGLISPREGSRQLELKQIPSPSPRCLFPKWFSDPPSGQWQAADASMSYQVEAKSTLWISPTTFGRRKQQRKEHCYAIVNATDSEVLVINQVIQGCSSGYTCNSYRRKDDGIIEIKSSRLSNEPEVSSCRNIASTIKNPLGNEIKNPLKIESLIVMPFNPMARQCPWQGTYLFPPPSSLLGGKRDVWGSLSMGCRGPTRLEVGCAAGHLIEIVHTECEEERVKQSFTCLGSWNEEDNTQVVLAYPSHTYHSRQGGKCFIFQAGSSLMRGKRSARVKLLNSCDEIDSISFLANATYRGKQRDQQEECNARHVVCPAVSPAMPQCCPAAGTSVTSVACDRWTIGNNSDASDNLLRPQHK